MSRLVKTKIDQEPQSGSWLSSGEIIVVYWGSIIGSLVMKFTDFPHALKLLPTVLILSIYIIWPYLFIRELSTIQNKPLNKFSYFHLWTFITFAAYVAILAIRILAPSTTFPAEHNLLETIVIIFGIWSFFAYLACIASRLVDAEQTMLDIKKSKFVTFLCLFYLPIGIFSIVNRLENIFLNVSDETTP